MTNTANGTPHGSPTARRRSWFEAGGAAFSRSFPTVAATIPFPQFYVCPLCLQAFSTDALVARFLTREHAPPQSLGGRRLALTCKPCNDEGGHSLDIDMRGEANLYDFATGQMPEIKAELGTSSGQVPIRFSVSGTNLLMFGVPHATNPDTHKSVMGDFETASAQANLQDFTFKVSFPEFSPKRAGAGWLRSAYLAFFSALGYRFVFRPELSVVRDKIRNPDLAEPSTFRIIQPELSEPKLVRIETPEPFRSYAMFYGRNVVFLPRYNDRELYARLATHPETTVKMSGLHYPWPTKGPTFFHDR